MQTGSTYVNIHVGEVLSRSGTVRSWGADCVHSAAQRCSKYQIVEGRQVVRNCTWALVLALCLEAKCLLRVTSTIHISLTRHRLV